MSIADFEFIQELGNGAFGSVFKVKRKTDGEIYALKKVKVGKMNDRDRKNALNEVRVLASMCHPNVVDYKEAFYDEHEQSLNLVMEFADEGDLASKIKNFKNSKSNIPESEIWSFLIQMTLGLKSLHDKKIMHRDLKSANVFINKKGEIKIGDLNVSKVVKTGFLQTQTGTPYYASPEVWSEKPYDYKSDIWSFGCVLYELCSLKPPFRAHSLQMLYKTVIKGSYEPIPNCYSKDLSAIVNSLLNIDPRKRPSCDQLLSNSVIKKKIENENFQITICEGTLLNTIKWPNNNQEINKNLSKLKRYEHSKTERRTENFSNSPSSTSCGSLEKPITSIKSINSKLVKLSLPTKIAEIDLYSEEAKSSVIKATENNKILKNSESTTKCTLSIPNQHIQRKVKSVQSNHSLAPANNRPISKRINIIDPSRIKITPVFLNQSNNLCIDLCSQNSNVAQSKKLYSNNGNININDEIRQRNRQAIIRIVNSNISLLNNINMVNNKKSSGKCPISGKI